MHRFLPTAMKALFLLALIYNALLISSIDVDNRDLGHNKNPMVDSQFHSDFDLSKILSQYFLDAVDIREPLTEYLATPSTDGSGVVDFESFFKKHKLSPLSMEKHRISTRNSFMNKNRIYAEAHADHLEVISKTLYKSNEQVYSSKYFSEAQLSLAPQTSPLHQVGDVYGTKVQANRANAITRLVNMRGAMLNEWFVRNSEYPYGSEDMSLANLHDIHGRLMETDRSGNEQLQSSAREGYEHQLSGSVRSYPPLINSQHSITPEDKLEKHERSDIDLSSLSKPSSQPSRQPTAQPTTQPTESQKYPFYVYIDRLQDGPVPKTGIVYNQCAVRNHTGQYTKSFTGTYVDIDTDEIRFPDGTTSGFCNYRAAIKYCFQTYPNPVVLVPYDDGVISECVIVWPKNSQSSVVYDEEIVIDIHDIRSKHPINIVFDGRGSVVTGNFSQHFITTTPKNDTNYNISNYFQNYDQFKVDTFNRRLESENTYEEWEMEDGGYSYPSGFETVYLGNEEAEDEDAEAFQRRLDRFIPRPGDTNINFEFHQKRKKVTSQDWDYDGESQHSYDPGDQGDKRDRGFHDKRDRGFHDPDPEASKFEAFEEEFLRHYTSQDNDYEGQSQVKAQDQDKDKVPDTPVISIKDSRDVDILDTRSDGRFSKGFDARFKKDYAKFDLSSTTQSASCYSDGGTCYKLAWSTLTFKNITLENFGYPASNGGCLKLRGIRGVVLDGATLRNCSGVLGGGMFLQNIYHVDIFNSQFFSNQAMSGGAAFIYYTKSVRIFRSYFEANYARNVGGAVAVDNTLDLLIVESNFTTNTAYQSFGGGISIVNVLGCADDYPEDKGVTRTTCRLMPYGFYGLRMKGSSFIDNYARYGSAIAMAGNIALNHTFCQNYFDDNKAERAGTVYWLFESGMNEPYIPTSSPNITLNTTSNTYYFMASTDDQRCFNNFTHNNFVAFEGYQIQTEPISIISSPRNSTVMNYSSAAIPVKIRVDIFDFYSRHSKLPKETYVSIGKQSREDCHCWYNTDNCVIVGKPPRIEYQPGNYTKIPINKGYAIFDRFIVSCIPSDTSLKQDGEKSIGRKYSAYIIPTFTVYVNLEAFDYPRYLGDFNKTRRQEKAVTGRAWINFRECVDGEKYDYFTSTRSTCSVCTNEYSFKFISNTESRSCIPCPAPVKYCIGKDLILYPGTFRWTNESTRIYECPLIGGCLGSTTFGENSCGERYYGPWCGKCKPGYYQSKQTVSCEPCEGKHNFSFEDNLFILIVSLFFFVPFGSWIVKTYLNREIDGDAAVKDVLRQMKLPLDMFSKQAELVQDMLVQVEGIKKTRNSSWISRLKMTLVTYQIISLIPQTLQFDFPFQMNRFVAALLPINLDFLRIVPVTCYAGYHFLEKLQLMSMFPVAVFCIFIALYILQFFKLFITNRDVQKRRQQENEYRFGYLTMFLIFLYFFVPGLCTLIFQTYVCVDVDPLGESALYQSKLFLRVDFEVSCDSPEYLDGLQFAYSMAGLYAVSCPLLFLFLLYLRKDEIIARDALEKVRRSTMVRDGRDPKTNRTKLRLTYKRLAGALGFLYFAYEPKFWYWDFIEICRRLMLTSFLSVVFAGTIAQVTISIAFSLIFIKVYNYYKPYLLPSEDSLSELCQYQIFFTLFSASVFMQQSLGESPEMYVMLDYILVLFNLSVVFLNLYYLYTDIQDAISIRRQCIDSNALSLAMSSSQLTQSITVQSNFMAVDETIAEKKRLDALANAQKEPIKLVKEKWKTKFDVTVKEDVKLFIEIVNNMSDDDVFRMQAMIYENIIKYERRCADKIWIYCQDPILIGTFNDVKTGKAKDNALIHAMPLRVQQIGMTYEETKDDLVNPRVPVPKYVKDLIEMDVGFTGELFRPKKDIDREKEEAKENNMQEEKGTEDKDDDFDDYEYQIDEQRYDERERGRVDDDDDGQYDENGVELKRRDEEDYNDGAADSDEDDMVEYRKFIKQKKEEMRAEANYFDIDEKDDKDFTQKGYDDDNTGNYDDYDDEYKNNRSNYDVDDGGDGKYDGQNLFDELSDDGDEKVVVIREGGNGVGSGRGVGAAINNSNINSTPTAQKHECDSSMYDEDNNDGGDDSPSPTASVSVRQIKNKRLSYSSDRSVSELDIGDSSRMKRNLLKNRRGNYNNKKNNKNNNAESTDYDTDQSLSFTPKVYHDKPDNSDLSELDSAVDTDASHQNLSKVPRNQFHAIRRNIVPIEESGSEDESSIHKSIKSASARGRGMAASDGESLGARSDRGFSDRGHGNYSDEGGGEGYNKASAFLDKADSRVKSPTKTERPINASKVPLKKGQMNNWNLDDDDDDDMSPKGGGKVSEVSKVARAQPSSSRNFQDEDERNLASDFSTDGEIRILNDLDDDDNNYEYNNNRDSERDSDAYESPGNNYTKKFAKAAFDDDISINFSGRGVGPGPGAGAAAAKSSRKSVIEPKNSGKNNANKKK